MLIAVTGLLWWLGFSVAAHGNQRSAQPPDVAAVFTLALFAGLRWQVGTDFSYYERAYTSKLQPGFWLESVEQTGQDVGFASLSYLSRTAGISFETFSFVVSAFTVVGACWALWQLSDHPRSTLMLYVGLACFLAPLNTVRQGMAITMVLIAVAVVRRRRWRWWLPLWLMATVTMHYSSALIIVILALLHTADIVQRRAVIARIAAAAVPASALMLPPMLEAFAPGIRYLAYFGEAGAGLGTAISGLTRLAAVAVIATARTVRTFELWAVGIGALFVAAGFNSLVFARFDLYLWPFAAIALPGAASDRHRPGWLWAALIAATACYFVFYLTHWGGLLPYQSFGDGPIRFAVNR